MTHPPRMRPRFEVPLGAGAPHVLDVLRHHLARPDCRFQGQVVTGHAMLTLPRERRSLLSPVLNLEVAERPRGPVLVGRFSPQPNVWTGFMAVYGVLGLAGLGGLMYGFAQLTVDEAPWAMLAAPIALALIGFVYGAAFIGQGLTVDEMYGMRAFVDGVAAEAEDDARAARREG
ncbi:MAG: hypothetical protein R3D98_05670 [Candidatus Krumholzibacteriia bacterium]